MSEVNEEKEENEENEEKEEKEENEEKKEENNDNTNSEKKNGDNKNITSHSKKTTEPHGKCVPLELYQKVYNDRKELLTKVNNFNLIMKQKENEKTLLKIKIKKYEKENKHNSTIMLNQEKYVNQLNKKIEKLESIIMKYKEEIINKDNEIMEAKEKLDEFKNNLENYRNIIKLDYKQKIDQINEKLMLVNKELEIKNNKMENMEKKYQFLQEKFLKTLNKKNMAEQESVYKTSNKILKKPIINKLFKISQSKDNIFNFLTSQSNTINLSDTTRIKHKEVIDTYFYNKEKDVTDKKDNGDLSNKNLLPNIETSKSLKKKKSEKKEKILKKNYNLLINCENNNLLTTDKNNS